MVKLLAKLLKGISNLGANAGTTACVAWLLDEPECPKSIIEK